MSNMAYCMFRNTLNDLKDCYDALSEEGDLSPEEEKAKKELINVCKDIVSDYGGDDE